MDDIMTIASMRVLNARAPSGIGMGGVASDDAQAMEGLVVRALALSFMTVHLRQSLLCNAAIYFEGEPVPACPQCHSAECAGTIFMCSRDYQNGKVVFNAPHHKGNMSRGGSSRKSDAMLVSIHAPPLVLLLREWVFARDLLYEGVEPDVFAPAEREQCYTRAHRGEHAERRWLLMKADPRGVSGYRTLRSGEATEMLRAATGADYSIADLRHVFITVMQGTRFGPRNQEQLQERLRVIHRNNVPDWARCDTATGMGNTLAMWSDHYDAGEMPRHAATCEAVLHFVQRELMDLADQGKDWEPAQDSMWEAEVDGGCSSADEEPPPSTKPVEPFTPARRRPARPRGGAASKRRRRVVVDTDSSSDVEE